MDNNYCVYKHTSPNGKVYIGLTGRNPSKRWNAGHGYRHSNPHFWNAIQKYGWSNITHEILATGLTKEQASDMERFFIALYNSTDKRYGYNKTYGGEYGAIPTEEIKLKFSGKNHWAAKRIEQYSLNGDYIKTFECIADAARELNVNYSSISQCARHEHYKAHGYIWIYEDDVQKEYWIKKDMQDYSHGENNPKARKIVQYDLNGKYINTYSCMTEAAEKTNSQISRITDCARGNRISSNGFIWLYEDDEDRDIKLKEKVENKKHPVSMCGGANHQAKKIEQYSLDGKYIATFPSAQTAADETGINYSAIKSCANRSKKNHLTSGGYIWINADEINKEDIVRSRIERLNNPPKIERSYRKKKVLQFTLNGKCIREFNSITEAQKITGIKSDIGDVCRGKRKTAGGYNWKFA